MNRFKTRCGAVVAGLAMAIMVSAGTATAKTIPVDVRTVTNTFNQIADVTQYVGNPTVRSTARPDCFDPGKTSTADTYKDPAKTYLDAFFEASLGKRAMRPFELSNADFGSLGSLTVCRIGRANTPPGFLALYRNNASLSTGASLQTVSSGDDLVAFRTNSLFSTDELLLMTIPARTRPGVDVGVHVDSYDFMGVRSDGAGVTIKGGIAAVVTDANGDATIAFDGAGKRLRPVVAFDQDNDILHKLKVCVAKALTAKCSNARGREILGSARRDGIKGTNGDDLIKPGGGSDRVKARGGDDVIDARGGGLDTVKCGAGFDRVAADATDLVAGDCEVVKS